MIASSAILSMLKGFPENLFAISIPATMALELLPSPQAKGKTSLKKVKIKIRKKYTRSISVYFIASNM